MTGALILYGSAARGDNNEDSDIDLLIVTSESKISSVKFHGMEMQAYSETYLLSLARSGNLFAIHLAWEGRPCVDNINFFPRLKSNIKIKRSYAREIAHASALGFYLLDHSVTYSNNVLINKRIAWCARTIMIAKLVERGVIAFSPQELLKHYPETYSSRLVGLRRSASERRSRFRDLKSFLEHHGTPFLKGGSEESYIKLFTKTKNDVALSTVKALRQPDLEQIRKDYT